MTICKSCGINTAVYGVCSYDPNQCEIGQAKGRLMEAQPWRFADESPYVQVLSDVWYFIGFALILTVICLVAGIGWGLFERFYPSTVCMMQQVFSINCK